MEVAWKSHQSRLFEVGHRTHSGERFLQVSAHAIMRIRFLSKAVDRDDNPIQTGSRKRLSQFGRERLGIGG